MRLSLSIPFAAPVSGAGAPRGGGPLPRFGSENNSRAGEEETRGAENTYSESVERQARVFHGRQGDDIATASGAALENAAPAMSAARMPMDEAAFRQFYAETAPKLRAYIRRACGDAALADDILQDAFYRFLRADFFTARAHPVGASRSDSSQLAARAHPAAASRANTFEPWQMKAYLYRAANSLLVDHWRRAKRERRWSVERFLFGGGSGNTRDAEPAEERKDEGDAMRLFRRLKPREQALLWMAYVEGLEHREIAAALDVGEKSVRVLLFRARKKLGEALRKQGLAE